ncbi:uncharacterized protein LOC130740074 [Lotus japonicus]|uniref:uncharacterized protein LOC130740074 n=1 Tax=Lotus japonicus TaxID=34305 RepID=UPI0025887735|nr:uncharacterized protein LOC130740074 [Lotus japonicus]
MDTSRGPGSDNPIAACTAMLSLRQFSACRDFASRFPPSDRLPQILAIAEILSAGDLYSVLNLRRSDAVLDLALARRHYAKLALLLDPTSTDKFPFSDEALARVREAWHVLSDPERRGAYDREFEQRGGETTEGASTETFWTACPYCWNLYLYEKRYQDSALQCQSCRRAFHGIAVKPPVEDGEPVVEGEERRQYYWCRASVPLKFYEVKGKEGEGGGEGEGKNTVLENATQFVYISDDDVGGGGGGDGLWKKVGVVNEGCERVFQGNGGVGLQGGNGKRRMRVKTVAKRSVGNRMTRCLDDDIGFDLDADDGELEFTEGADDVFIGVRFDDVRLHISVCSA